MPDFKKNKSAFMMKGKSPMMKALVGDQHKLPKVVKDEIAAVKKVAPVKNYKKGYYGA